MKHATKTLTPSVLLVLALLIAPMALPTTLAMTIFNPDEADVVSASGDLMPENSLQPVAQASTPEATTASVDRSNSISAKSSSVNAESVKKENGFIRFVKKVGSFLQKAIAIAGQIIQIVQVVAPLIDAGGFGGGSGGSGSCCPTVAPCTPCVPVSCCSPCQ